MKAAAGFALVAVGLLVLVAGVTLAAFGLASVYDQSWSCPPGSLVVLDGFGFKAGCAVPS